MLALNLARPRPAAPPGAPIRPARGILGFRIDRIKVVKLVEVREELGDAPLERTRAPARPPSLRTHVVLSKNKAQVAHR